MKTAYLGGFGSSSLRKRIKKRIIDFIRSKRKHKKSRIFEAKASDCNLAVRHLAIY